MRALRRAASALSFRRSPSVRRDSVSEPVLTGSKRSPQGGPSLGGVLPAVLRGAALLLLAAAAFAAAPDVAEAQSSDPIWSATMTVGESTHVVPANRSKGFNAGSNYGSLTSKTMTRGSSTATVNFIYVNDAGALLLSSTPAGTSITDEFNLCIGNTAFAWSPFKAAGASRTHSNSGLSWSVGDMVALKLIGSTEACAVTDSTPDFGGSTVSNQTYVQHREIPELTLPAATGGDGTLTYSLTGPSGAALPAGLSFDANTRKLTGTPTGSQAATTYTYKVTDSDSSEPDSAELTFTIAITANAVPSFGGATVTDKTYVQHRKIPDLTLPAATGGDGTLSYTLEEDGTAGMLPPGLSFDANTRKLTGTPTHDRRAITYHFIATDSTLVGGERDAVGLSFKITITANAVPSFGGATITNQSYTQNAQISELVLPTATGGDGTLTYELVGDLPAGLNYDSSNRKITGTPTATQAATTYTWRVTDNNGDKVELTFDITVAAPALDIVLSKSSLEVPVGGSSTYTVRLNRAPGNDETVFLSAYQSQGSTTVSDKVDVSSSTLTFSTTNWNVGQTVTVTAATGAAAGDTAAVQHFLISNLAVEVWLPVTLAADSMPTFGAKTISNQTYTQDMQITELVLPTATDGNGTLTYELVGDLPAGLSYDAANRKITGTPAATQAATTYTWRATDDDGDKAELTFTITVTTGGDQMPSFAVTTLANQSYPQHREITELTLPQATGGDGTLTYSLEGPSGGALPAGLSFDANTRKLTGTPTATQSATTYTYKVTDSDASNPDSAELTFTITVTANAVPKFAAGAAIPDLVFAVNKNNASPTFPQATGGDGTPSYSVEETLPTGLTFDGSSRKLSGTPTSTQSAMTYTFVAEDNNGDKVSLSFKISVVANATPSFGASSIDDLVLTKDSLMSPVTLPTATSGNPPLNYGFSSALPTGLSIEVSGGVRTLKGTPTERQDRTSYAWQAGDSDGETAEVSFTITIVQGSAPSFSTTTIDDQSYTQNTDIGTLQLPTATGGDGTLTYELVGDLPAGLSYDSTNKRITGTPTGTLAAKSYTWRVSDTHGDKAELTFTITVSAAADQMPSFAVTTLANQSYPQHREITELTLPQATGGDGTLTYSLEGPSGGALPAGLSFDADTRKLTGTPTTVQAATTYTYKVTDGDATNPDSVELTFDITVTANAVPKFAAGAAIPDVVFAVDKLNLSPPFPQATGGDGTLTYSVEETLPTGLRFDGSARQVIGTPTSTQAASTYTFVAEDNNGDKVSLSFKISVTANATPSFGASTIGDQVLTKDDAMTPVTLPTATSGNTPLTYGFKPSLPAGLSFEESGGVWTLKGTPTARQDEASYAWEAEDRDGEVAKIDFTITVVQGNAPSFGNTTIDDQTYTQNTDIGTLQLPTATGGDGTLTYLLLGDLPTGLTFDRPNRRVTGTPTGTLAAKSYTWQVSDTHGDKAELTFTITVTAAASDPIWSATMTVGETTHAMASDRERGYYPGEDVGMINSNMFTHPTLTNASITVDRILVKNSDGRLEVVTQRSGTDTTTPVTENFKLCLDDTQFTFNPWGRTDTRDHRSTLASSGLSWTSGQQVELNLVRSAQACPSSTATDLMPSFGMQTVDDLVLGKDLQINTRTLPAATGGNGTLTYSLAPQSGGGGLPAGLSFDANTRQLSGTPTAEQAQTAYVYKATDSDATNPDSAELTVNIEILSGLTGLTVTAVPGSTSELQVSWNAFASATSYDLYWKTGDGSYLTPQLVNGTTYKITSLMAATTYQVRVLAFDDSAALVAAAEAAGTTNGADNVPDFGSEEVTDQTWTYGTDIGTVTLPPATGGDGTLKYSLSPDLPDGLAFDANTRKITGTPTATKVQTAYTYTVTDSDASSPDTDTLQFNITVAQAQVAGLTVTAVDGTTDELDVSWDAVTGATSYRVRWKTGVQTYGTSRQVVFLVTGDASDTTNRITGLNADTTYSVQVTAIKSGQLVAQSEADGTTHSTLTQKSLPTVRLSVSPNPVTEGSSVTVTATLSATLGANETIPLTLTRGTAEQGDFGSLASIVITGGQTTGTGQITTAQDDDADDETFTVALGTLPGTVTAGTPNSVTVTIRDDDGSGGGAGGAVGGGGGAPPPPPPAFGADTVADQSYTQNTEIETLTLPTATGGNGTLSYTLTGPDGGALPDGLSFDAARRTLSGTPTGSQDAVTYTYTVTDADGNSDTLTFTIEIAEDLMPTFGDATVANQSWTQGTEIEALVLPEATGGNGTLSYTLTGPGGGAVPAGLALDAVTRTLSGTPSGSQAAAIYTWTATDADGDTATLTFAITIAEDPHRALVQGAVESALAAVARRTMAGALENVGARMGDVGASGMSLAGQWVPLEGAGATAAAAAEANGLRPCTAERFGGSYNGSSDCAAAWTRTMTAGELFGQSAFSVQLGASEDGAPDPATPLWSVWGRGDLGTFAGRGDGGLSYDGELRTGWLGVDARAGPWVAGLAVSHGEGEADYAFSAGDLSGRGRLETTLTAVYPYGRWTLGDGLELRGMVGAGEGKARHEPEDGAAETGELAMRMASLGVRRALPDFVGIALAVRGDASVTRIETEDGPDAIHGLSADSWRLRAGTEASRRFALDGDAAFEPFLEAAVRRDGGDGLEGSGVELAGGLRWVAPGVAVEARGRWLAAHSEDGAEEKGVSLTARAGPGADGRGPFIALAPRWGAAADGARALWSDEIPNPSASAEGGAVDARLGYGFGLAGAGVLTPFAEAGLAGGDSRRLRLGTRFDASRVDLRLELAGERRESAAATPEHALRLDLLLRF